MQLRKKLKNFLVYLILISFTTAASAQHVTKVNQGDRSPHTGWCLSDVAMAKIIADKEMEDQRCALRLETDRGRMQAKYDLDVGNLNLRIRSIQSEYDKIILIKNEEISALESAALERPNNYWYFFLGSGIVVGVLSTVGIVYLVK